jgi:hypothetical protein
MMEQARQAVADFIAPKPKKPDKTTTAMLKGIQDKVKAIDNTYCDREDTINLAYLRGKQHIYWNDGNQQVCELPKEDGKTRYVANRLIKIFRTDKSRIFKSRAIMDVVPATSDEEDIAAAKLADKVISWLEYDKKLQKRDEQLVSWGLSTRIGFIHPYWNPSLGQKAGIDPETGAMLHEGDIDYDVLSCFEVVYDNSATCWDDVRWVCKKKVRDVDYVERVYGVKVKPEGGLTSNNIYDTKMAFTAHLSEPIKHSPLENHVRVFEYWELPCDDYPQGRRVTYTENHTEPLFVSEDIGFGPEDDTERLLPFFPFVAIDIPGSVSGTNNLEQCRPAQREYNRTRSQLIDSKDLTAYPKVAIQNGSMNDEWDNEIAGVVHYNDGTNAPDYLNPPQAGSDAYKNCEQILEEMDYISGQSQVSHGRAPADASGYLVELLLEQDDTVNATTVDNYVACKQAYMSYSLKMIRFKYIAKRTLRIVGRGSVELVQLSGQSIKSYDVRVQRGNLIANSRVAKRAEVYNMMDRGLLDPVNDREKAFRYLEFGMIDDIYNEPEQDQKQAKKEQIQWEQGVIEPDLMRAVRDFFNHPVHIEEHNRWRKSLKYEALDPDTQEMIDMHVAAHQQYIDMQMMQRAQMAAMTAPPKSPGTPHSPMNLQRQLGNGGIAGNSMQGREQSPA